MITIDGSQGEGGGQIVRSSLALSLVTGKPVTIENIRAGRKKPGLLRQHLTATQFAAQISDATIEGVELGSNRFVFKPGVVQAGEYRFSVGSAGSTTLVFQTVLPALMLAEGNSTVEIHGGTHNPFAPPFDFLTNVYLPLLKELGPTVIPGECQPGFYPAGGGSFRMNISPCQQLHPFELLERGKLVRREVRAVVAKLPKHIAERECKLIARKTDWDAKCFVCEEVTGSSGPGNVVMIELEFEHVTELFVAFGEIGKKAERVANAVIQAAREYIATDAPVGAYLADQLVLPMGIAAHQGHACAFRTSPLTQHTKTHIDVLQRFLEIEIVIEETGDVRTVRLCKR
ncbi:MAG: RNA 3'-terminal phosphate cyclase [Planctomycetes bacterium]|nr:RNA 3'-terminal phosphate cyclase [Planctomycetota bacterium]